MQNGSFKLLTLNIAHGRGPIMHQGLVKQRTILKWMGKIAELLEDLDADIVALQEIDEDSQWNGNLDLLEFLRDRAGYPFAAYGMHNRREGKYRLNYGNAFLSRHAILDEAVVAFDTKRIGNKGFLYCRCDTPVGVLDFINLHLDFKSRQKRLIQCHEVKRFLLEKEIEQGVEKRYTPIVMGDFNAQMKRERDAARFLLEEISAHTHYRSYPVKAQTFPSYLPRKSIDYILVPDHLPVVHSEVVRRKVSDHRAVLVEINPSPASQD
ncbi:MAG: endonuclease/exonuclease/phosphatase family protein [Verrucomicrobiae bacterium]|nr:endonuclease/exonuclease/phosphatase family protein [Verrucomicrobiae bacterium]